MTRINIFAALAAVHRERAEMADHKARYFLDTEFDENGTTIKLISIGIVSEHGDEYYAVAADGWSVDDCDPWVRENVVAKLPPQDARKPRAQIAKEVREFLSQHGEPEIWAYFADYDWVVLCQLFGKMIDLPKGFPMFCMDLKQEMVSRGVSRERLPPQDPKVAHDALSDARWTRDAWVELTRAQRETA
jgi:hypothetical protein